MLEQKPARKVIADILIQESDRPGKPGLFHVIPGLSGIGEPEYEEYIGLIRVGDFLLHCA